MSTIQETTILGKLRSWGYWRVVIRPTTFQVKRIARFDDLLPIVDRNSVQLRGWDYPHVDRSRPPLRGADWVGQEYDCEDQIEVWRFYQSGLFLHYFAIAGDWRDLSTFLPAEPGWAPLRDIDYLETIYKFVEIFEFATRLALSPAGASPMHVEIDLEHLENRRLVTTSRDIVLRGEYCTQMPRWNHRWEGSQTDLIARPRELAALAAQEFFARFGLNVTLASLSELQQRITP